MCAALIGPLRCALLVLAWLAENASAESLLTAETKIPLENVRGRIDHMAIDLARERLYVAELGNNSVGVIDLKQRQVIQTLSGLHEPQGIGYSSTADTLYVATAGDGSVHVFQGPKLNAAGVIKLGEDADNVRINKDGRILVGYGGGAIALIDQGTQRHSSDISLKGHPESFQLDASGHIFVNVPTAHEIAVLDQTSHKQIASWGTGIRFENFPMALDEPHSRIWVVFRHPASLVAYNSATGAHIASTDTCGDSDDVFIDTERQRVYVVCGEGFIDVFSNQGDAYSRLDRLKTVPGARTGLYVSTLNRLFLAVRATTTEPAAVWVVRVSEN
jgi:YVTN family beta-propeller protein